MTGKKLTKLISLLLIAILAFSCFTGFTYQNGFGTVYYNSKEQIFDGTTYNEMIGNHPSNGIEHAYWVESNPEESGLVPYVFNGEVRGKYTLKNMIKYANEQGYKVVAAINGDLFDTSSGTPKNPVIHGGNIVTSGYAPDRVIAFDSDGKASLKYAALSFTLNGTIAYTGEENVTVTSAAVDGSEISEVVAQPVTITEKTNTQINFFNVPHGSANGLHLYNRHYASSTKTTGSNVEVVINCSNETGMQLRVNSTVKGTVASVNTNTANTPIGENQLVLSTVSNSATSGILSCLVPGSEVEINTYDVNSGNANSLEDTEEAMGIYYSIVENGRCVTSGTSVNPRTAFGIKSDGSIVLYEIDGRQASHSKGVSLPDLANIMISLGCDYAFNLDGGGSSAIYSRWPGIENNATRKNSPSGGSERAVANGLLLCYKSGSTSSEAEHLKLYPALSLVMPGASIKLSTCAANAKYEISNLPGKISYSVDENYGTISSDGTFTAGNTAGRATINATAGDLTGTTEVEVVRDITMYPSVSKVYLEKNQKVDINMTAKVGTLTVNSNDSCFEWKCDENIGTIDQNGLFVASEKTAQKGNIYVSFDGKTTTIPVQVGALTIDFSDTVGHWAQQQIGVLAARGILGGIGDNMFAPDYNVTRAQFLAMLAKSVDGLDIAASVPAGFSDVPAGEWYYNYVNWGYENGIVNGMGENLFCPDANITREQMTVMLCNFAKAVGYEIPQNGNVVAFTDASLISGWASEYVDKVVNAGIINGLPEGNFSPQGSATRAQAAKVLYVFTNLREGISG
ncbi:MAG: S-layer homology domain-containing protein [Clostridia bacterium]|nr:S-layer homology domain-containing protein [Clostridia bacterium]